MKYFIYCDESGEISFSSKSPCKCFSICALTIDEDKKEKLKNTMKRKKAELYNLGWPKNVEVKANILHNIRVNKNIPQKVKNSIDGDQFIRDFLLTLKQSCIPRIDYIAIRKDRFTNLAFRNAPYGITYNFFAGKLLSPIILHYKDCFLTVDKRNKEIHPQEHFNGYIETKTLSDAFEKEIDVNLEIIHEESLNNSGLQTVDLFSWSVYRKIERGDPSFFEIFEDIVCKKQEWYFS